MEPVPCKRDLTELSSLLAGAGFDCLGRGCCGQGRGRDSAVHRGLARPYLSFQNGRRSFQAQALCTQRAKEESLTELPGASLQSLGPGFRPQKAERGHMGGAGAYF